MASADLKRELEQMVYALSKSHHSMCLSLKQGLYIEGEKVYTVTLAVCLLHLQRDEFCNAGVTAIDDKGRSICVRAGYTVKCCAQQ